MKTTDSNDKGLGTRFSLFQVKEQPSLVQELGSSDFRILWNMAVKVASQYEDLCRTFEQEWIRRNPETSVSDAKQSSKEKP
jgi:hypothetical protein